MKRRVPRTRGQRRRLCYLGCYKISRLSPRYSRLRSLAYAFRVGRMLNRVLNP